MTGVVQDKRQEGYLKLAELENKALERSQDKLTQASGLMGAEKEKAFKSRQEKQSLKANVALQQVAAKRAAVAQGIAGITSSAAAAMGTKGLV
jgi:hypothetical protein